MSKPEDKASNGPLYVIVSRVCAADNRATAYNTLGQKQLAHSVVVINAAFYHMTIEAISTAIGNLRFNGKLSTKNGQEWSNAKKIVLMNDGINDPEPVEIGFADFYCTALKSTATQKIKTNVRLTCGTPKKHSLMVCVV